jgi:hypothetical protein
MKYIVTYAQMEIEFTSLHELTAYIRRLPIGAEITVNIQRG